MSQKFEYFGKYILLEKLAAGGMAEVFLSRAPGAGGIAKFVAIKRILPQYSDNQEFIDMFKEEAKIAVNLSHSNIVSIYEFGVEANQFFLVMDYVEGRNLRQLLNKMKKSSAKFTTEQIVYVIKEVAGGLDHAHRCLDGSTGRPLNITHRDMSPQNIMVSYEGEVKIIDFGIAKAESQLETTRAGTLKGKYGYMSPEQAEGHPVDLRTDIFSLGIVLWELMANDRLFIANNEINTLRKIRDCQVPSLRKINPNIHPELERITQKALARDKNLRYQTAAALHRDLNRFLNRHYPDFSSHDFAVFIKTLYADEILETRRRVVSYAKIPFKSKDSTRTSEPPPIEDKTMITPIEGITGSYEEASLPPDSQYDDKYQKTPSYIQEQTITTTEKDGTPDGISQEVNTGSEEFSFNDVSSKSNSILREDILKGEVSFKTSAAPNPYTLEDHTPTPNQSRSLTAPKESEAGLDTNYSYPNQPKPVTRTDFTRSELSQIRRTSKGSRRFNPINLIMMVTAVVGVFLFLSEFFPKQMAPVLRVIGQNIPVVVDGPKVDLSSQQEKPLEQKPPSKKSPKGNELPSEAFLANDIAENRNQISEFLVGTVIRSEPSGADIYIDGKKTGKVTPSRLELPTSRAFSLTLKKDLYITYHKKAMRLNELTGRTIDVSLQRASVGFLDIDVIPPRNVSVYVNGRPLTSERLPIMNYAVPAGAQITVKAVSLTNGEHVEKKIRLNQDQRSSIILTLPNSGRSPSRSR